MLLYTYTLVRKSPFLGLALLLGGLGCRGPQRAVEEAAQSGIASVEMGPQKNSEARMAPDEMFFAGQYLGLLTRYSQKEVNPNWSSASLNSRNDGAVFEFTANFSSERLELMTQLLLKASDTDADGQLSESEFLAFRWDPKASGAIGPSQSWGFSKEVYQKLAAGEASIGSEQLRQWLGSMGPLLKSELDVQGEQSYRLSLLRAWDAVLTVHDLNQDGRLDQAEQKLFAQERNKVLLKLLRE